MTDTIAVRELIKEKGLKLSYVANEMDLTTYGLSLKLDNVNEFKSSEISMMCEMLGIDDLALKDRLFFAKKVDLKSTTITK